MSGILPLLLMTFSQNVSAVSFKFSYSLSSTGGSGGSIGIQSSKLIES